MKRVVLAMGNEEFHTIFRKFLREKFLVSMNEVFNSQYLMDVIEEDNPDIIFFHDKHFGIAYDPDEENQSDEKFYRETKFLDIIEYLRQENDNIRIGFVCERTPGDPFLSELVNNNVLDIFYTNSFDMPQLVEQMSLPPKYSNVAHLKVENSNAIYKPHLFQEGSLSLQNILNQETEGNIQTDEIIKGNNEKESIAIDESNTTAQEKVGFFSKIFGRKKSKQPAEELIEEDVNKKEEITEECNEKEDTVKEIAAATSVIEPQSLTEEIEKESIVDTNIEAETLLNDEESRTKKLQTKRKTFSFFKKDKDHIDLEPPTFNGSNSTHRNEIKNYLIAVVSLTPGAGSTFFLHNFTRYLSLEHGITSSILDTPSKFPIWYHLACAEQEPHEFWEDVHCVIKERPETFAHTPKWNIDNTFFFPCETDKDIELTTLQAKELIYHSRLAPTTFVDLSHSWDNTLAKETLAICDQVWVITEQNRQAFKAAKLHHKELQGIELRKEDIIVTIGNKWNRSLDFGFEPTVSLPYFDSQPEASLKGIPLYKIRPKLMKQEFDKLLKYLK